MKDHTVPHACDADIDGANAVLRDAVSTFNGKWKLEILWLLSHGTQRFNAMRRALPGITQHTLTHQLRELERDGMVTRTVYPEVPPRVEYDLTEKTRALRPVFDAIFAWARGAS